ncbi:MAG TPA: hypothetical protein VGC67_06060 [Cellulomonas sp.]
MPETIERLDANAAEAGAETRSDIARLGIELAAASLATRHPGLCCLHGDQREEAMYVVGGEQRWFCESTQQLTQGTQQS